MVGTCWVIRVCYVGICVCRLRPSLNFVHWNTEGWKTGLCSVAPVGHPYSLLTLANNTCVWHNFQSLHDRFVKLYKRKVTSQLWSHSADTIQFQWYCVVGLLFVDLCRNVNRVSMPISCTDFIIDCKSQACKSTGIFKYVYSSKFRPRVRNDQLGSLVRLSEVML